MEIGNQREKLMFKPGLKTGYDIMTKTLLK